VIVKISEISQVFYHAHMALVNGRKFPDNHWKEMVNLWEKEYGVKVISKNGRFYSLEFASEVDCTVFLLRWS